MRKRIVVVAVVVIVILSIATFYINRSGLKKAGIVVNSTPTANVFINGSLVGTTPYDGEYKAGDITLKLVPTGSDTPLFPYEAKITLLSGVKTVVQRRFGASEEDSSGDIINFVKDDANSSSISVVSIPGAAQVMVDGIVVGSTPFKTNNLAFGEHTVNINLTGYSEKQLNVRIVPGYKLVIVSKLGRDNGENKTTTNTETPGVKRYVVIGQTETGYLRVRSEPGNRGEEIAQVKSGEKYLLLDRDTTSGWYKIQFKAPVAGLPNGISGWVSGEYVQISNSN